MNFAAYIILKRLPLHMALQVEEVTRLLNNGELVDVGDLWTGEQIPFIGETENSARFVTSTHIHRGWEC